MIVESNRPVSKEEALKCIKGLAEEWGNVRIVANPYEPHVFRVDKLWFDGDKGERGSSRTSFTGIWLKYLTYDDEAYLVNEIKNVENVELICGRFW